MSLDGAAAGTTSETPSGRVLPRLSGVDPFGRASKVCPKCGLEKPADTTHFPSKASRAHGRVLTSWCRLCVVAGRSAEGKVKNRLRRYGLAPEEYERLKAHGKCQICEQDFVDERHHPRQPVIDHDHETGRVRGVICRSCNLGLGYFNDDPTVIGALVGYLMGWGPGNISANSAARKP